MTVAVLDIGKTNVKLSAASDDGTILESLATANATHPGPPYRHHDLAGLERWIIGALAKLARRHAIDTIVPCGHGSGGVLVGADGPAMPMIDYEDTPPASLTELYRTEAGDYRERGSPILLGASHTARQLLWLQTGWPAQFAAARWFLGLPQFWAWRLCGVAAAELTTLGAQSHLWSVPERGAAGIVARRGWTRLMPPLAPAWATLGTLRPELAGETGLPATLRVLCGIHDSSANFYRYQAAGLRDLTVVSTGTWIVALTDRAPGELVEARGMTCNADPAGNPLAGALCMGGREFALIAGAQPSALVADPVLLARLVTAGAMALPCFGEEDGLLPGRAGRGHFAGPPPSTPAERRALALLATALLTDLLLDGLDSAGLLVIDGSFAADPIFPALIATLRPFQDVRRNLDPYGSAAGAALLAGHERRRIPAALTLQTPPALDMPGLAAYRARWRHLAAATETPR